MAEPQDFADVVGVLDIYFEGLYYADSKQLAKAFHPDARYVNTVEGDYMNYSLREYFNMVDARVSPANNGESRANRIISIEFGGRRMAFAKVSIEMLSRDYLDFLTLTVADNRWRIISKVFSYTPKSQEA